MLFPPFDITQLRDSISQTVAFSIVCYRNHYFCWGNLFRFLRSHPKSSNRRRYFPSSSYRLTGPKWNFPSPPFCTNIHQPNPFVKSQRINKKTSGGKKSQTIYPTSINFSKWAAPTFSSPTRIIVDVIIKYHTALSLSHHTHKNWSSKSLGGANNNGTVASVSATQHQKMGKEIYLLRKHLNRLFLSPQKRRWKGGLKSSYGWHMKFTVISHAFYMKRHVVRSSLAERNGDFGTTQKHFLPTLVVFF